MSDGLAISTSTDGKCPTCHGDVYYYQTTRGYDDPETGDREDPIRLYRCPDGCGLIPEDDLDWSPSAPPKPLVAVEDGDVVEYRTTHGHGRTAMGTVDEVGDTAIWLDVDGQEQHDLMIDREMVVRVVGRD